MNSKLSMKNIHSPNNLAHNAQQSHYRSHSSYAFQQQNQSLGQMSPNNLKYSPLQYDLNQYDFSAKKTKIEEKTKRTIIEDLPPFQPIHKKQMHPFSNNELQYLLKNQSKCMAKVKKTISEDTEKIQCQFKDFQQRLNNVIDDLKISMISSLNEKYSQFLKQYKNMKVEYINYCNIKKIYWQENEGVVERAQKNVNRIDKNPKYPFMISGNNNGEIDNKILLNNLIQDLKECHVHVNYRQFEKVQQKLLKPLLKISKKLCQRLNVQSYLQTERTYHNLNNLVNSFQKQTKNLYGEINLFTDDLAPMTLVKNNEKVNNIKGKVQRMKSQERCFEKSTNVVSPRIFNERINHQKKQKVNFYQNQVKHNQNQDVDEIQNSPFIRTTSQKQKCASTAHSLNSFKDCSKSGQQNKLSQSPLPKKICKVNHFEDFTKIQILNKQKHNNVRSEKSKQRWSLNDNYPFDQQKFEVKLQYIRSITDKGQKKTSTQNPETAICLTLVNKNQLAVGTKSGKIKIFCTKTGAKLTELIGHKSSICSLSTFKAETPMLISGGDIGCCEVIIWNLQENTICQNFRINKAAVTSIVDVKDGRHFICGSFDKTINIFNVKKRECVKVHNTNQKVILLNKIQRDQQQFVVSAHLNAQIMIWKIQKNAFASAISLEIVKKINVGTIPYSLNYFKNQIFVNGKDNYVRSIDIQSGNIEKVGLIGDAEQIISLDDESSHKYIGCMKNGAFLSLSVQPFDIKIEKEVGGGNCLLYSCGINPKHAVTDSQDFSMRHIFIPNHKNTTQTEIRVWIVKKANQKQNMNFVSNTY